MTPDEFAYAAELIRTRTGFVSADRSASLFSNYSVGDNIVARLGKEISGAGGALRRPAFDQRHR